MTKEETRIFYKAARQQLTEEQLQTGSEAISRLFLENFSIQGKTISLFLPITRQHEINTWPLLDKLVTSNAIVGLPKTELHSKSMIHYRYESRDQISVNSWGIPEPENGELITPQTFDLVIVPLLAVNQHGHRVGYGKGFYDRFLQECKETCLFVGFSIFSELADFKDSETHDIPLNYCVTPEKIHHFGR